MNGIKSLEVYNPIEILFFKYFESNIRFTTGINSGDFKVEMKRYGEGSYMGTISVDDVYTTDNQTYEVYLAKDDIYKEDM